MKIYDKIAALVDKTKYSASEREFIVGLCADNGIQLNTLCKDCFHDAVIQLAIIYKPKAEVAKGAYELRPGLDVILNGTVRVCEATLTDENAEKWLKMGLPKRFFVRMPE